MTNKCCSLTLGVGAFVKKHSMIRKGDRVFVSCSGGIDSSVLLHVLKELRDARKFTLEALHINFGLRGNESLRDERFTRGLAGKLSIPVLVIRARKNEIKNGENAQTWARRVRLETYKQLTRHHDNVKIALAHNRDDQVETFFIRLLRGGGMNGLGGMSPVARGYMIRPFLATSRKDIEKHAKEHGIPCVKDSTNERMIYFRNWIRKHVIPQLEKQKIYANPRQRIAMMMNLLREEEAYLNNLAGKVSKKLVKSSHDTSCELLTGDLLDVPFALRLRVLRNCIKKVSGTLEGVSLSHIELVEDFIGDERGTKELYLSNGVKVVRVYNRLRLEKVKKKGKETIEFRYVVKPPCKVQIDEVGKSLRFSLAKRAGLSSKKVLYLDWERFSHDPSVRNFRAGDRIALGETKGRKKIKKIFINSKIPREERMEIPFIVDGDTVAAIMGFGVAKSYRVSSNTRKILKILMC